MFIKKLQLVSLVQVLLITQSCILCLARMTSNFTDQSALLAFKSSIKFDPGNVLASNWTENSNFCDWFGVSCSRRRHRVTALSLRNLGLHGTISPQIGNLSFLVSLDLKSNNFHGHLPSEIGNLRRLEYLNLDHNKLEGSIPSSLQYCRKLQGIGLADNGFSGKIPVELTTLSSLSLLLLGQNQLTGMIPTSFGNSSSLEWIGLEYNKLYGHIPTGLHFLQNLKGINFAENNLTGEIPPEIFNISSIQEIWLNVNELSGNLPLTSEFSLPKLSKLCINANLLTGSIPSYLSNASKLTELRLSGNKLTGQIPTSIAHLQFLRIMSLSDNLLTGPIPREMGFLRNLHLLDLQNISLNGSIPSTIGEMKSLQRLYITSNELEGSIPSEICLLSNLGELRLNDNKLSGSIPSCIANLSNLKEIILNFNMLSSMPSELWRIENLVSLHLSFNLIGGSLEPNMRALKLMEYLDFSHNKISGNLPSTIGAFQSLTIMNMSGNLLSEHLPESLGKLRTLAILDLSHNNFSGRIPKSLEALSQLKFFNLSVNKLTGEIPMRGPFENITAESLLENQELCGNPKFRVPPCPSQTSKNSWPKFFILKYGLPASASVIIFASLFYMLRIYLTNRGKNIHPVELKSTGNHQVISYHELQRATKDFHEANLLGKGGFGCVYKGMLSDGTMVAVKVLNLQKDGIFKSFDAECKVLSTVRHRNLVKILSVCSHPELRVLVLQYMSNGSLENWLYSLGYILDIFQRVSIMLDVALALEYLHHGLLEPVVHCDLKPNNILLDDDMVAYVGDFGIAKILVEGESLAQTKTLGTFGYIAPEYGGEGRVSIKGDIYSYGILLLETFTRKKPTDEMFAEELNLRKWVNSLLPIKVMEAVDSDLLTMKDNKDMAAKQGSLLAIMKLGLDCSTEVPDERCDIKNVVVELSKIKSQLYCVDS